MNWIDRMVLAIDPARAVRRAHARQVHAYYEAAKPSSQRRFRTDVSGPNRLVHQGAVPLRIQMRHLDRNHDITRGSLDVLVNNTVGPTGIGVEFAPRRLDGSIHQAYADALGAAWRDWCRRPEVTQTLSYSQVQRLQARTLYRDGEVLAQRLIGPVPLLDHGTRVPYSLELMEPDLVPMDYEDAAKGIKQGIQCNAWGRPVGYWVYKGHPGEGHAIAADLKVIPAARMLHAAHRDRIGQLRGVTRYASVITRIEDIKDYEESERIAAKIAAMLTAYVKRQAPDGEGYVPQLGEDGKPLPREISLSPGTIIDTLAIGEEIGLIDAKRPNPNLVTFRHGQLRAFASGIGASFSSVAKAYEGTYSSQRQELVEQWVTYACLTDDFVGQSVRPVVEDFIYAADLSGVVPRPRDAVLDTEDDVLYIPPSLPWIDPAKEVEAWLAMVQAGFASEVEVIRKRGGNPDAVLKQLEAFRKKAAGMKLTLTSDAAAQKALAAPAPQQQPAKAGQA